MKSSTLGHSLNFHVSIVAELFSCSLLDGHLSELHGKLAEGLRCCLAFAREDVLVSLLSRNLLPQARQRYGGARSYYCSSARC